MLKFWEEGQGKKENKWEIAMSNSLFQIRMEIGYPIQLSQFRKECDSVPGRIYLYISTLVSRYCFFHSIPPLPLHIRSSMFGHLPISNYHLVRVYFFKFSTSLNWLRPQGLNLFPTAREFPCHRCAQVLVCNLI